MAKHDGVDRTRRELVRLAGGAVGLLATSPLSGFAAGPAGRTPLKIGTIGAGHIGGTLGSLWVKAGHPVMFSSRHPDELQPMIGTLGRQAHTGTVKEAIAFADAVLLAVPYHAVPQIGKHYGHALAAKALVIDATNPIPRRDAEIALWARKKGAGLAAKELLPGVRLVRAFNAISWSRLEDIAASKGDRIGMPMAGDDANAIALASTLVHEVGFEPVVIGPLAMGNYLLPGSPLAGEHTPEEIRKIAATLK